MLGKKVQIGSTFAKKLIYDKLVGAIGIVVYVGENNNALIRLTEVPDVKLLPYVNEKFMVHINDCLLLDAITPEFSESGYDDLAFGQIIQIGSSRAKELDYEAAVGCEAVVEYKMDTFACVAIITGPLSGEIRDIIKEDCKLVPPASDQSKVILVNHSKKLILYTEAQEIRLFKHVRGSFAHDKLETFTGELSDVIERFDYQIMCMLETESAKELMIRRQTGGGSEGVATQSNQESE